MNVSKKMKHVYDRVDYSMGKKLFGNTAGVRNNLTGKSIIKESRETNDPRVNQLIKKQYVFLEKQFDVTLIESVISKYNDLIENDKTSYVTGEYEGKVFSRHILEPEKIIPELNDLITDDIRKMIQLYYNGSFQVADLSLWRNYHVPNDLINKKELFSNYWHCDNRSPKYLKLFVPLHDIKERHGPFHAMSRQRTKEMMKRGFGSRIDYNLPDNVINDPNHVIKAISKKGDAYFTNPQFCLHQAGNPDSGCIRDILVFVFSPSSIPLPNNWIDEYSPDKEYRRIKEK